MHTTILRFHVRDKKEFERRAREDFLPAVKELPGFVGYYGIDGEGDTWGAILVFKTREDSEAARQRAMDYARERHLHELVEGGEPELIVTGETVIAEMVEQGHEERRAA